MLVLSSVTVLYPRSLKAHDVDGTLPTSLTDDDRDRNPSVNRYQVLLTVILREAKKLYQRVEKDAAGSGEAVDSARLRQMLDAVNDAACLLLTPDDLLSGYLPTCEESPLRTRESGGHHHSENYQLV